MPEGFRFLPKHKANSYTSRAQVGSSESMVAAAEKEKEGAADWG